METAAAIGNPDGDHYDRVSLFATRYRNLVDFDPGPPPLLVNRGAFDVRGIAARAQHVLSPSIAVAGDVTWLSFKLDDDADPIRNRPTLRVSAYGTWTPSPPWTLSVFGVWVGERFDSSIPTGGRTLPS